MEWFLNGELTESIELFQNQLHDASLSLTDKAIIYSNIAYAEFGWLIC